MIVRPSAWRAYSASSAGSRVSRALSPTASTIAPRSRIETPSREQRLQHALDLAEREHVRHDLLDDGGVGLLELVEQLLDVLAGEQLGGVRADRLGQVGDDHRLGVDDRVAERLGLGARWPSATHIAGRPNAGSVVGMPPGSCPTASPGSIASWWPAMMRPRATSRAAHLQHVLVRVEPELVVDPHRRDHHAELGRDLAADHAHAREQRAARALRRRAARGRSRSPARAGRAGAPRARRRAGAGSRRCPRRRRARAACRLLLGPGAPSRSAQPIARKIAADEQERQLRQARDEREARRSPPPATSGALRWPRIWPAMSEPRSLVGGRARDDDAGRDRDQQRRDLRGEAVADGQQRVVLGRPR